MLTTTVIGSRPKPDSLSSRNHDTSGWTVDRHWEFRPEKLKAKQGEAIEWAARQQEAIGVDVVSDEEQRCDNYVYYFCRGLDGFDFDNRAVVDKRSGAWSWNAPGITGSVASAGVFLVDDFRFTQNLTDRQIKVTIPGLMTIIDSVKNEYYRDESSLAMDLAAAILKGVRALVEAGCQIIQFDEPALARYPKKMIVYGIRALEACFDGIVGVTTAVHICRGAPVEGYAKANIDNYTRIAPTLAIFKIDQVSIEGSGQPIEPQFMEAFGDKTIIFGLIDIGKPEVETVSGIESQIRRILEYVGPDRLALGPDCGMIFLILTRPKPN